MNQALVAPVSDQEIKQAVFNIKGGRGPDADGLNGRFYQHFGHIVGPALCSEIKYFFRTSVCPSEWNFIYASFPKVVNPTRMTEIRSISLCSVHYKIISKILCSRLKRILHDLISDTQGTFVSGRLISDNILSSLPMRWYTPYGLMPLQQLSLWLLKPICLRPMTMWNGDS